MMSLGYFLNALSPTRYTVCIICWCYLLVISGVTVQATDTSKHSLLRVQCKATCLKKYVSDIIIWAKNDSTYKRERHKIEKYPQSIYRRCGEFTKIFPDAKPERDCKKCLVEGCEKTNLHSMTDCRSYCKGHPYCEFGCNTILRLIKKKSGQCPQPKKGELGTSSCYHQCRTDSDCGYTTQKCCSTGCGKRCMTPNPLKKAPPMIPRVAIFEETYNNAPVGFAISWQKYDISDFRNPILFEMQLSAFSGRNFRWELASKMTHVALTSGRQLGLHDLSIGYWYRIKIAAVNSYGTLGFQDNIQPATLKRKPKPPTPPRNVTDGIWRIHASGGINVQISWTPPKHSDLTLTAYLIQWVKDLGYVQSDGRSLEGFTKFKKHVPKDKHNYTIENLEPGTSYKVQVLAYAKWGDEVLESQPNTLFITTPKLSTADNNNELLAETLSTDCRCGEEQAEDAVVDKKEGLHIYKPEYEKYSLNIRILLLAIRREFAPGISVLNAELWAMSGCPDAVALPVNAYV